MITNKKSEKELRSYYRDLIEHYNNFSHIFNDDFQCIYAEIVELLLVKIGEKPAFLGMVKSDAHDDFYKGVCDISNNFELHFIKSKPPRDKWKSRDFVGKFSSELNDLFERVNNHEVEDYIITSDIKIKSCIENGKFSELDWSTFLGYPDCCVDFYFENFVAPCYEIYVKHWESSEDKISSEILRSENIVPDPSTVLGEEWINWLIWRSESKFPANHFKACSSCLSSDTSPASTRHKQALSVAKVVSKKMTKFFADHKVHARSNANIFYNEHVKQRKLFQSLVEEENHSQRDAIKLMFSVYDAVESSK